MIVALYSKVFDERCAETMRCLLVLLDKAGVTVYLYAPLNDFLRSVRMLQHNYATFGMHSDLHPETRFLMSVGGDGTFLDSITIIRDSGIPVVGINIGRLGFLATIAEPELEESIENLLLGKLPVEERTLLQLGVEGEPFGDFPYALNDMVIQKKITGLITIQAWIDDEFLNSYWADGLIVSTPTGSSAYSLSVGGPIVAPESENFIISPIAPHNLTVRPLIIPDSAVLRFKVECRNKYFIATLDSRSIDCPCGTEFELKRADFKIKVVKSSSFYATLRNKLMWGADRRN